VVLIIMAILTFRWSPGPLVYVALVIGDIGYFR
jgi:hypothetical protein